MRAWNEIFLILEEARSRIRVKVEELVEEIHQKYGVELSKLAEQTGTTLYLAVEEGNGNPAQVTPVLYVVTPRQTEAGEAYKGYRTVFEHIGEWAGDYRLTVKPLNFKPTQYKQKYGEKS